MSTAILQATKSRSLFSSRFVFTQARPQSLRGRSKQLHSVVNKGRLSPHLCEALPGVSSRMVSSSSENLPTGSDFGNFKLVQSFSLDYAPVKVSKWKSEKTGLTVVLGSHQSPITNGYFVIASEIFDDTGRPHTLEHLIFLGSKTYPYKGVLDSLANRAGSNGTNAWTANDHTAYTIATAGSKGFLEMLPVYVDHILHPTLTDSGFVTEVHHINGSAEDSGVVYSEMQGRENQSGDLMALETQRMLYPTSSAYRSETGGLLKNLRVLTVEQIREYHSKYYVPYNLCLNIDGAVSLPELFHVLNEKVEPMIMAHQASLPSPSERTPPTGWKRPFVETSTSEPLSIPQSQTKVVEFMEEDESMGEVSMIFLGPPPTDYTTNTALKILGKYLTHSATSPLQKEFIEIPKPFATSIVFYAEDRVGQNEMTVYISDVPAKHLMQIGDMVKGKLEKIVKDEGIDMVRMGLILRRDKRKMLNYMETSVSDVLVEAVIGDFLYADVNGKQLPSAFDDLKDYAVLEGWKAEDWTNLLDKYFVSAPSLTAIGKPSAALAAKIEKDEKERVAKQKEELGEEGLKRLAEKLEAAKKDSDKPIPPEMLTQFPITDPATITWVPVETAVNDIPGQEVIVDQGEVQRHIDADSTILPFQAHFAHVKSHFVTVNVAFDTVNVPSRLMPYLSILQNALFSLGVKRADGTVLDHEEVVNQLNDFTVSQSITFDYRGCFSEVLCVSIKVEKSQYEDAVAWIRDLVSGCIFTKERLSVIVAKQLQELPQQKRDGSTVSRSWINELSFDREKSTSQACALLSLLEFLPATASLLESDPEKVIASMEEARRYLLDPSSIRVSVAGNILDLPTPRTTLSKAFLPFKEATPLRPISTSRQTLTTLGEKPSKKCVLIPMSSIEGSYSIHFAKGPVGWDHSDLPALKLACSVLNAMESYLWKSIRGAGLAYGASIEIDEESGLVGFSVYRSPNATLAYEEAGKVLTELAEGILELDKNIVDGARSSMTYDYARKSETVMSAASTAYLNEVLKGVSKNHGQELLNKLPGITLQQLRDSIATYLLPLFSPATAIGAVAVSTGKADEVEAGFAKMGFEVERKELPTLGGDEEGSSDGDEGMDGSGSGSEESGDEGMEDILSP